MNANSAGPDPDSQAVETMVHASCVLVGRKAVLIRGRPGSGKSSLAASLISRAGPDRLIRLVTDDATLLCAVHGRLLATAPSPSFGLVEMRGLGLVPVAAEPKAVIGLVVDLVPAGQSPRLPSDEEAETELLGVRLPRLSLQRGCCETVMAAMRVIDKQGRLPVVPDSKRSGRDWGLKGGGGRFKMHGLGGSDRPEH